MNPTAKLRERLRAHRRSPNPFIRHGIGVLRSARAVASVLTNAEHRSVVRTRLFSSPAVHQTTPLTWMDRYPDVFAACRTELGDGLGLRLLSFGCSTGEEVLTLRRYFPLAAIVGAEINRRSLATARRNVVDDRISVVPSSQQAIRRLGPYDAIFCMAVLQRTPHAVEHEGVLSLKRLYPFEKFDDQVRELDACLKVGGLLVVHLSQYRVADTAVAARYVALESRPYEADHTPKFDCTSRRTDAAAAVVSPSIFVKLADAGLGPTN